MCFLGLLGILLMIVNNEITFGVGHNESTILNWFIKLSISISTIPLIGLIIYYHKLDLNLYSIKNTVDDWHIGLTGKKLFLIILEIIICIIHPIPLSLPSNWSLNAPTTVTTPESLSFAYVSFDVALGLPSK
jgi:potassium intermediate/small conductance calcium-activated channel subfamily N protein 4